MEKAIEGYWANKYDLETLHQQLTDLHKENLLLQKIIIYLVFRLAIFLYMTIFLIHHYFSISFLNVSKVEISMMTYYLILPEVTKNMLQVP